MEDFGYYSNQNWKKKPKGNCARVLVSKMLVAISLPRGLFPHEQRVLYRMLLDGTQLYHCEIGQTERWFCGRMETFYHQLCLRGCSWRKLAEGSQGPTELMGQRKAEEPSNMQEVRKYKQSTSQLQHLSEKPCAWENTLSWADWYHNATVPTLVIFVAFSVD